MEGGLVKLGIIVSELDLRSERASESRHDRETTGFPPSFTVVDLVPVGVLCALASGVEACATR